MQSTGRGVRLCVVSAAMLLAATWVAATEVNVNSVPASTHLPAMDTKDGSVEGLDEKRYHWVVTRDGELANSVYDVGDPDELSRYSEFDVTIKQRRRRRKRKLFDNDVTGVVRNSSEAYPGELTTHSAE